LYNDSPVKDKVVVNDRWGDGVRFKHAGIYTPEYQPDLDFEDHYWEESRGMGYSYGYNREEDAWDYNSTQSLVLQLIDKVSRGGNFLLDIGPDEHGKIPPIMQERLLQMGEWLKINGEAIYGTSRWKEHSQWSEGNRNYKDRSGDMLLKITINPDPGYAVKEVFYTYNATTNNLYAILPRYPDNRKLILKNCNPPVGTAVSFLSTMEKLNWRQQGNDMVVGLPEYNPNKIKSPYAYVVKIAGYGRFTAKPDIKAVYDKGAIKPMISLQAANSDVIYYTTDGSTPTVSSTRYSQPFNIDQTSIVKAIAVRSGYLQSAMAEEKIRTYDWKKAIDLAGMKPGIHYKYYEPAGHISMASMGEGLKAEGNADEISISKKLRADRFAFEFTGYVRIPADGVYTFFTRSDDGSKLFIDGEEVVNNDGDHGSEEKQGKAALKKGYHKINVIYFDSGGGNELKVFLQPEGGLKKELDKRMLFH